MVLNCIENITKNFVFYNKATIERMFETQSRQDVAMVPKEVILTCLSTFKLNKTMHTTPRIRFC